MPDNPIKRLFDEKIFLKRTLDRVFSGPDGEEVLRFFCREAGITRYVPGGTEEDRIRLDERRRFVFSLLRMLNKSEESLFNESTQHTE